MIYFQYLMLVISVVGLSLFLSKYVDALDKKTDMSGAFIGGVLLAAVTSLPEFITSLTAILALNEPNLVQGNVFGSNIFNLTVLGAAILFASKKFKDAKLSNSHKLSSIFAFLMFIMCFLAMKFNATLNLGIFTISFATIGIIILYIFNLSKSNGDDDGSDENDNDDDLDLTVKQISIRFLSCAILLVLASMLLTNVTDKLNNQLQLGATIGGAIFLGIATSLPELTSSFNLIRLGNFNAAFGNIIGSNLFNFTILALSDLLYTAGNIFYPDDQANTLIIFGTIAMLLSIFTLFTRKNRILSMLIGALILSCYVASIIFSL